MTLWHKNQRFLTSTRGQIITLLRRSSHTVDELAQALGLTDNAIRAHLANDLAPEAEQLFPKAYGPVLQQLLDVLDECIPTSEVETLLREVGRRIAGTWKVPSGDLRVRLGAAVEDFNELGGMAELEACDGHFCIRSYSCPLADVVLEHPEVCHLAETLLTELVGVPVQKHCDYTGSPRCSFTVPNT